MKETSIIQTQDGDKYVLSVIDADITLLSDDIQQMLSDNNLQIGEIIIERTAGKQYTCYKVLYQIATWLAGIFAQHQGLILYYLCDDMNPIPNQNTKGKNKDLSPQEYRSSLFTAVLLALTWQVPIKHLLEFNYSVKRSWADTKLISDPAQLGKPGGSQRRRDHGQKPGNRAP